MAQAGEAIRQAKISAGHTKIYSPINGVILVRPKEPGEVITAGAPVLTMANIEKVWLKAYVGETDLGKVKLGQKVIITTDSYPEKNMTAAFITFQARPSSPPRTCRPKKTGSSSSTVSRWKSPTPTRSSSPV